MAWPLETFFVKLRFQRGKVRKTMSFVKGIRALISGLKCARLGISENCGIKKNGTELYAFNHSPSSQSPPHFHRLFSQPLARKTQQI